MASFDLCERVLQSSVFPTVDVSTMAFVSLGLRPDILIQAVKKEFRRVNVVFLYRSLGEDAKRCDIVINLMCELLGRVATGTDPITVARLFNGVGDQPSKKIRALVLKSETSVLPTTFERPVFLPKQKIVMLPEAECPFPGFRYDDLCLLHVDSAFIQKSAASDGMGKLTELWIMFTSGLKQPRDLRSHLLVGTHGLIAEGYGSPQDDFRYQMGHF